jgi:imidazolonepropionase-like amidohydrolase
MITAINNVRIIDGSGGLIEKGSVRFSGDGILDVAKGKEFAGDFVIDGSGSEKTLMPGMIDCHAHLAMPPVVGALDVIRADTPLNTAFRAYDQAWKMIRSGVTTVRNAGSKYDADVTLRDMIESGELSGPRILASGQVLCITGGHCYPLGMEVDDVSQAVRAAREQIRKGADVLKMMATGGVITAGDPRKTQMSLEQMTAVKEEADRFGKMTFAHCIAREGIANAIDAGVTSVEHGMYLDEPLCDAMIEKEIWLVPTLIATYNEWHPDINTLRSAAADRLREKSKPCSDRSMESFELALKKGVKIAFGTDAGTPFNEPTKVALELSLYIQHGMRPMEALRCATQRSAQLLRIDGVTGTLEEGKAADLLLIDGNPLNDIWNMEKVERVYRSGSLLYRA